MQRECFVAILFLLLGCKSLFPTHIQIFTGVPEKEYRVLGPVEAEWRSGSWAGPTVIANHWQYELPPVYRDEVDLALKQVAYTLFGDAVDAIINVKYRVRTQYQGSWRRSVCKVKGIAIQYLSSPQVPGHYVTYMYGPGAPRTVVIGE